MSMQRLQHLRQWLTLILIGLLPFHAFFVTVGTTFISGESRAPLLPLILWKEAVLGLVLLIATTEVFLSWIHRRKMLLHIDRIDVLIVSLLLLALGIEVTKGQWTLFAFGFKYDFVPLVIFLILRRVPWTETFFRRVYQCLLALGVAIAIYAVVAVFLPMSFFTSLGYSPLHSLYNDSSALAAFQNVGGTSIRRAQSVMSGPNQLGLWLLLPWSILFVELCRRIRDRRPIGMLFIFGGIIALGIVLTYSRSAWIAAGLITLIAAAILLPKRFFRALLSISLSGAVLGLLTLSFLAPELIVRATSSRDHFLRPLAAIETISQHPLGLGLGRAGPASHRVSDMCLYLEESEDTSWITDPQQCVFVGSEQIQPTDRDCTCPQLPENWYLQIGIELGAIGLFIYCGLIALLLWALLRRIRVSEYAIIPALYFLGICIVGLFLHAWEDAAVAYTSWILIAPLFLPKK